MIPTPPEPPSLPDASGPPAARGARRQRGFRVAAVAIGVAGGLLLGELGLRLQSAVSGRSAADADVRRAQTVPAPAYDGTCEGKLGASLGALVRPSAHDGVVYELKPDLDTCFIRVRVRTSGEGLRIGSEGGRARAAAPFRILLLGDSQAFGWGVAHEETAGVLLERELAAGGRSVEVLNAGVPGYNAAQEAAYLAAAGDALDPDCVVVLFMGNDFDPPVFRAAVNEGAAPRSYVAAAVRRAWRRWRSPLSVEGQPLEALAFRPADADPAEIPPEFRSMVGMSGYRNALASLSSSARRLRVPVVNFADYSYLMAAEPARELVDLQRSLGIHHPDFAFPRGRRLRLSDDDPHLSAEGHRALARRMAAGLRTLGVCLP